MLLRWDQKVAYPIVNGIPILLLTEALAPPGVYVDIEPRAALFHDVYRDMPYYDQVASTEASSIGGSDLAAIVKRVCEPLSQDLVTFPEPVELWLDAPHDLAAQFDGYKYLTPIRGRRVLQLGGTGTHAIKFLLAGASEAWVASPVLAEVELARMLAEMTGVGDRFHTVVAIAEQLPFPDGSFDSVYSGGCLHHTVTARAIPEVKRILRPGGKFGAIDPWRTPIYELGIKIFGKREAGVNCKPLDANRIRVLFETFDKAAIRHHGALTRYLLIVLDKFGIRLALSQMRSINRFDDRVADVLPFLRAWGSSVAVLARKES